MAFNWLCSSELKTIGLLGRPVFMGILLQSIYTHDTQISIYIQVIYETSPDQKKIKKFLTKGKDLATTGQPDGRVPFR
jgi:hypothetical protein